jgi:hypothetical protein
VRQSSARAIVAHFGHVASNVSPGQILRVGVVADAQKRPTMAIEALEGVEAGRCE